MKVLELLPMFKYSENRKYKRETEERVVFLAFKETFKARQKVW